MIKGSFYKVRMKGELINQQFSHKVDRKTLVQNKGKAGTPEQVPLVLAYIKTTFVNTDKHSYIKGKLAGVFHKKPFHVEGQKNVINWHVEMVY